MTEHTPTMERLRAEYIEMRAQQFGFSDLYAQEWDRAMAAHDAEVRAGVVAEEPEWEYGTALRAPNGTDWDHFAHMTESDARTELAEWNPEDSAPDVLILVRRTPEVPAGPWVPVEQGDETRTIQARPVGGDPSFGQRITMKPREQGDER